MARHLLVRKAASGGGGGGGGGGGSPNAYKWVPGDYATSILIYNTSTSQASSDITALAAHPSIAVGYGFGIRWAGCDTGSTSSPPSNPTLSQSVLNAQFPAFNAQILPIINNLQTSFPGASIKLYVSSVTYGKTFDGTTLTTYNFGDGTYIPKYIANCGGTLVVPNSYTSSGTTSYSVAPIYSGAGYYGLAFDGFNGTNLTSAEPQMWNPGVAQCRINFYQALSLWQFTVTAGPYSGQTFTLDSCPFIEQINLPDEYSFNHNSNPSGATVNPPITVGSYAASPANFFAAHRQWLSAAVGFFPHTVIGVCNTFGFGATGQGADSAAQMASHINANISPNNGISNITGVAMSGADTNGYDFITVAQGGVGANQSKQGFIGITSPIGGLGTALPAPSVASLTGVMPYTALIEPIDYNVDMPSGVTATTAAAVHALANAANNAYINADHRDWSMGDGVTFGNAAWTNYVAAALASATPCSTLLPTSLMYGVTINSITVNSSTSLTVNWSALTGVGTGMSVTVYRNGVSVATGQGGTSFVDTGRTTMTTYTYTLAMANTNGTGPQGSSMNGTTT